MRREARQRNYWNRNPSPGGVSPGPDETVPMCVHVTVCAVLAESLAVTVGACLWPQPVHMSEVSWCQCLRPQAGKAGHEQTAGEGTYPSGAPT